MHASPNPHHWLWPSTHSKRPWMTTPPKNSPPENLTCLHQILKFKDSRGEGLGGGVRSQEWSAGGRRGEQYLERSGRRTPPPYNSPRSHRAATATFGRIGPSTFKRLARFLVTWLFRVAGLWLRLGCCDRSGAFPERGGRGRRK